MPIQSKLPNLTPSSERLKKIIKLISGGYSLKPDIPDGLVTVYPWDSEVSEWVMTAPRGKGDFDFTARVVRKLLRLEIHCGVPPLRHASNTFDNYGARAAGKDR